MSDGLNEVRAMRLAEVVQDFRRLQHLIMQIEPRPSQEEYDGAGYVLLRECLNDGEAILQRPFNASKTTPQGNPEREKVHLQYVLLDASARRFEAHRIYRRATAAMRWVNAYSAVVEENDRVKERLKDVDQALSTELSTLSDARLYEELRSSDEQQEKWIPEDPTLQSIQQRLAHS